MRPPQRHWMTILLGEKTMAPQMITIPITMLMSQQGSMGKVSSPFPMQVHHTPSAVHTNACHARCTFCTRAITSNDHQNPTFLNIQFDTEAFPTPAVLKDDVSNICGCRVPTLCRVPSGLSVLSKCAGVHVGSVPTALVRHHRHHATGC